jgi:hypothetical protein
LIFVVDQIEMTQIVGLNNLEISLDNILVLLFFCGFRQNGFLTYTSHLRKAKE